MSAVIEVLKASGCGIKKCCLKFQIKRRAYERGLYISTIRRKSAGGN
jgi:hypothetical protein